MTRNKYSSIFAMCLLILLFLPQWTKAEIEETVKIKDKPASKTPVEFQMRNNETSGLNFDIKLFGGLGHLVGQNDVNKNLDGWNQLFDDLSNLMGANVSGEISPLGFGPFFGGELILSFNPRFSIGLGAGYLRLTKQSTKTLAAEGEEIDIIMEPKISAVPLTLSLYYDIPLGELFKVVIGAGAGYYIGQYNSSIIESYEDMDITILFDSSKNTIGAHGSLNIELNISRTMALIFGVSGRLAVLKDLMGTESFSYDDPWDSEPETHPDHTLWYVEEEMFNDKYYASLFADDEKPEGSWYRNVRKAEISLSSIALQIGILIKLGQLFK